MAYDSTRRQTVMFGGQADNGASFGDTWILPSYGPLIANAGPSRTVNVGSPVSLDGSSSISDGVNPLTYSWARTGSALPAVALANSHTLSPSFTVPMFGTYTFTLTASDGSCRSTRKRGTPAAGCSTRATMSSPSP